MKEKVMINASACIGCGLCASDCPSKVIDIQNKQAIILSDTCTKCGHCIAICPKNAVEISDLDMDEVKNYKDLTEAIQPDQLMDFYKSLRTIRKFKSTPIEKDYIDKIIEAGRYTATGRNRQGVRYVVVQDRISDIEKIVLPKLKAIQKLSISFGKLVHKSFGLERYNFDEGFLFKDARALILVISEDELDAGLAAKSMELMARTLGIGSLLVGIFTTFANKSRSTKAYLGVARREKIVACLALGYPDVKYARTVPRRKANVIWR